MTSKPFEPDWTVPPGDTLAELLEERGLDAYWLAGQTTVPADGPQDRLQTVTGIIDALVPVTNTVAAELERVLGPSAQFWLNYEKNYQDDLIRLGRAVRVCARCRRHLVDEDDVGWYYQVPLQENFGPLYPGGPDTAMTFMDRVHECDGQPHDVIVRDRDLMNALEVARQCPYC